MQREFDEVPSTKLHPAEKRAWYWVWTGALATYIIHIPNLFHVGKRRDKQEDIFGSDGVGLRQIAHLSCIGIPNGLVGGVSKLIAVLPIARYAEGPCGGALFMSDNAKLNRGKQGTALEHGIHGDGFWGVGHFYIVVLPIVVSRHKLSIAVIEPGFAHEIEIGGDAIHAGDIGHGETAIGFTGAEHTQSEAHVILRASEGIHTVKGIEPHHVVGPSEYAKSGDISHGQCMIFTDGHGVFGGEIHEQGEGIADTHAELVCDPHLHIIQEHIIVLVVEGPFVDGVCRWGEDVSRGVMIDLGDGVFVRENFFWDGRDWRQFYDFFSGRIFLGYLNGLIICCGLDLCPKVGGVDEQQHNQHSLKCFHDAGIY